MLQDAWTNNVSASVERIVGLFESKQNDDNAGPMKKYMRDQFDFLGIKTSERRELTKQALKEIGKTPIDNLHDFITSLWQLQEREYQYFAVDYLDKYRKQLGAEDIKLLEYLITTKSWWDTVDLIASKLVGHLFMLYPQLITDHAERWIVSDNMWLRRTVILFQLKYKGNTDQERLFRYIKLNAEEKEFFIQKAIGWALREYSKTNAEAVSDFIKNNQLAPLSIREGLKVINKDFD